MAYCVAFYCNNSKSRKPHLSFFRVPRDPVRSQLWFRKVWRQDLMHCTPKSYRVCSEHFSDRMFMNTMKKRLVHDAYPDLEPETELTKKLKAIKPVCKDIISSEQSSVQSNAVPDLSRGPSHDGGNGDDSVESGEQIPDSTSVGVRSDLGEDVEVVVFGDGETIVKDEDILKTDYFCRTCASLATELVPIFKDLGLREKIARKIHKCLPIKVSCSDELPQHICPPCLEKLNMCYDFVEFCLEADTKLRTLFGKSIPQENTANPPDTVSSGPVFEEQEIDASSLVLSPVSVAIEEVRSKTAKTYKPQEFNFDKYRQRRRERELRTLKKKPKKYKIVLAKVSKTPRNLQREMCMEQSVQDLMNETDPLRFGNNNGLDGHPLLTGHESDTINKVCNEEFVQGNGDFPMVTLDPSHISPSMVSEQSGYVDTYVCLFCKKIFVDKDKLLEHESSHHSRTDQSEGVSAKENGAVESISKMDLLSDLPDIKVETFTEVAVEVTASNMDDLDALEFEGTIPKEFKDIESTVRKQIVNSIKKMDASDTFLQSVTCQYRLMDKIAPTPHFCYKCGVLCNSEEELKLHSHKRSFPNLDPVEKKRHDFWCTKCNRRFFNERRLEGHLASHDGFRCTVCDKKFESYARLCYHKISHSSTKPYLCDLCGKGFKYRHTFNLHMSVHADGYVKEKVMCEVCGMSFENGRSLWGHRRLHAEKKRFACEVCGRTFASKIMVNYHLAIHSDAYPFSCDICGRNFKRELDMVLHQKRVHKETTYTCRTCKVTYTRRKLCKCKNLMCECEVCGKKLPKHSMYIHRKRHSKSLMCDVCGKAFGLKKSYIAHYRVHTGERPFECNICGKRYTTKYNRDVHRKLHLSDRQYLCSTCGKSFSTSSNLNRHRYEHSGELYTCHHCEKKFTRKHVFNKHVHCVHSV